MFAHPIDGIVAHVDLTNRRVARLIDTGYNHVPMESGDYLDPKVTGPMRTSMKPLHITQPEGASFSIKNHVLTWEKWEIRVGFNGREGLTLHDISFDDDGHKRPILNRASVSEMVVPYVDRSLRTTGRTTLTWANTSSVASPTRSCSAVTVSARSSISMLS